MSKISQFKNFPEIFQIGRQIATLNLTPGSKVYGEDVVKDGKREYRIWNPHRSKPAAAILRGLKIFPLKPEMKILYLGAASGTTVSHFSDIVGREGLVYAVEISDRSIRDLAPVAAKRENIVPILADARKPEDYSWIEHVDIVYEDVASDDQSPILIRNAKQFLKPSGFAMIAIKARSIDVTKEPKQIYKQEIAKLSQHFEILDKVELEPYEKDHMLAVMKSK